MSRLEFFLKRIFPSKPELLPWEMLKLAEFNSRIRSISSSKITRDSQLLWSKKMKNLLLIETLKFNLNPIKLEILRLLLELYFLLRNLRPWLSRTEIEQLKLYCSKQKNPHGILKDSNAKATSPIFSLKLPDSMDYSRTMIESKSHLRTIKIESLT